MKQFICLLKWLTAALWLIGIGFFLVIWLSGRLATIVPILNNNGPSGFLGWDFIIAFLLSIAYFVLDYAFNQKKHL